jgi:hypothetical protein
VIFGAGVNWSNDIPGDLIYVDSELGVASDGWSWPLGVMILLFGESMVGALPAQETAELYNRLIRLDLSEQEAIKQIEWQLLKIRRSKQGDPAVNVALLLVLTLSGRPEEAAQLAEELWARRALMPDEVQLPFAGILIKLAQFGRAVELIKPRLRWFDQLIVSQMIIVSFALGDVGLMWELAKKCKSQERQESSFGLAINYCEFLDELQKKSILDHIQWHQTIVNSLLMNLVTNVDVSLSAWGGEPEICISYYTPLDRQERKRLQNKIDDAIEERSASLGLSPGFFVPTLMFMVLDHNARSRAPL